MNALRLMIIAGEASSDTLASELIGALRQLSLCRGLPGSLECFGAGGPAMAAAGVDLAFDLTRHAVVGVWEAVRHYRQFKAFFDQLFQLAIERRPDAIILVDYPGFNLRFAHAIRRHIKARNGPFNNWNPRIIYYVSPQIWAWHSSRVYQIARDIDLMLSIFPFEKAWYAARVPDFQVEFVGHPMVDRFAEADGGRKTEDRGQWTVDRMGGAKGEGLSGKGEGLGGKGEEDAEQRTEDGGQRTEDGMGGAKGEGLSGKGEGLSGKGKGLRDVAGGQVKEREEVPAREKPVGGDPVGRAQPVLVLLLPGSRRREVRMHLPAMLEAAEIISRQALVRLRLVLPNEALVELARPWAINMPGLEIRAGGLADSLAESGLAIAASGTVTMECAFFRVPTVVIYRTSWSTYELGKRIIRVKYLAMPNLLANESVYPELIQHGAVAEAIASRATDLLHDPLLRAAVQAKLSKVIASLGPPGASQRAAQAVLDHLGTKRGFLRIPLTFSNQPST